MTDDEHEQLMNRLGDDTSHEPALALLNELRLVRREIAMLQDRLGKRL